jgi:uncharacterized protein (DUF983 family)
VNAVAPSVFRAMISPRCPRCGQGKLFDGYLKPAETCSACGLDYSSFDSGDGPMVFVIFVVSAIVAGGALILEVTVKPPYWVHAVIWGPAILILSLGLLRPFKAALLVLQYRHKAAEGRRLD